MMVLTYKYTLILWICNPYFQLFHMNFNFIIIVLLKWIVFQGEDDDADIKSVDFPKFMVVSN